MKIPRRPPNATTVIIDRASSLGPVMSQKYFLDFMRKCERVYWPWDRVRMAASSIIDAELAWALIKLGRVQRYHRLELTGHNNEELKFNVPDFVQRELMLIDQQLAGSLLSQDDTPLTERQKERFIISALREEAIASSMLEGAVTTRREAKILLKTGRKPKTRGERMVVNNYLAIQFVRDNRGTPLSPDFLLELQKILTLGTLENEESVGRFRTDDDNIQVVDFRDNEIVHTPPPASELSDRLERLCKFANLQDQGRSFIHPVTRACILHFQLGFDHPFCDGNGRTARALFYWMMLKTGYWLFEYIPISRLIYRGPSKYARAFLYCETDDFDVTYFMMYKAKIIERARTELRAYLSDKQRQLAQARKLLAADRRLNHRQQQVLLHAVRNPDRTFTIAEHQNSYAVSYGTARSDLLELAEWGYLNQATVGNRYDFHPSPNLEVHE